MPWCYLETFLMICISALTNFLESEGQNYTEVAALTQRPRVQIPAPPRFFSDLLRFYLYCLVHGQ